MLKKLTDELRELIGKAFVPAEEVAGGRQFSTGTLVKYKGPLGIVRRLNQGSHDPYGTTVDLHLSDGTIVNNVKTDSSGLEFFRA